MASGTRPVVLTIAGFDPSSGAGITADLKTIASYGCHGVAAITALTVQNSRGARRVELVNPVLLQDTLSCLTDDNDLVAIKIGMLGKAAIAEVVAGFLESQSRRMPIVLDPIIRSSSGHPLLDDRGIEVLRTRLMGLAKLVTPNLAEASALAGFQVTDLKHMKSAAKKLQEMGARNVVVTGGHLPENVDLLRLESGEEIEIAGAKVESTATHGTGCAFSTAVTCGLALGDELPAAVRKAKEFVRQAIEAAYTTGKGKGVMNQLFQLED